MRERTALITGAGGMLAHDVRRACAQRGWSVHAPDVRDLDITDHQRVIETVSALRPQYVFNCAAFTDVDRAEAHEAEAMRVNAEAPGRLAEVCADCGSLLIHFSTDYIFSAAAERPIPVDAEPNPVSVYGRSKLEGERAVRAVGALHLIVRSSWLYAERGRNFVQSMLRFGAERDAVRVVDDQRGRPTLCSDLAKAVTDLIDRDASGVFHVANSGACSWYEFACEIMRLGGLDCTVRPCTTDAFPRPARRPSYSVLDLTKTEELIGQMRPWTDALAECITRCRIAAPRRRPREETSR